MDRRIFLCSDLDRTLLPNGSEPEDAHARPLLREYTARPEVSLAFVTGRDLPSVREVVAEYELPVPDYIAADVGASIHQVSGGRWRELAEWRAVLEREWRGLDSRGVLDLLGSPADLDLEPQEPEGQGAHKLSFYCALDAPFGAIEAALLSRLEAHRVEARIVSSVDDVEGVGLIDVLPPSAGKLGAVRFLARRVGVGPEATLFAGDSGNDLDVLTSDLPAVLVANATAEVRAEAVRRAEEAGSRDRLHLATGAVAGMSGNYSAGVLDGLLHFFPETASWLRRGSEARA